MKIKEDPLRQFARSKYWQMLFNRAKEIGTIQLFDNVKDFSVLQIILLQRSEIYTNLYMDLAMNEDLISEEVINDPIRCDAYLLYKRKERDKQKTNGKKEDKPFVDRIMFRPSHKGNKIKRR